MDTTNYEDVIYEVRGSTAFITFNRPERMNAFRASNPRCAGGTYEEVADAILTAGWDRNISAIVLSGAGNRAFSVGGDGADTRSLKAGRGITGVQGEELHASIRDVPKPVIAKVRGFAIGGGNVLVTLCDLAIASENAIFGQIGPRMGSVDPGYGTAQLARVVGEKRAREMWFLCERYSAAEALAMGLVNRVVPDEQLDAEVDRYCAKLATMSPTAIGIAKASFNADSAHLKGISTLGFHAVALYKGTPEAAEAGRAFREKRDPVFDRTGEGARGALDGSGTAR
jgi:2-ketocyclohexanecarboxyl-CoA hydrolase